MEYGWSGNRREDLIGWMSVSVSGSSLRVGTTQQAGDSELSLAKANKQLGGFGAESAQCSHREILASS